MPIQVSGQQLQLVAYSSVVDGELADAISTATIEGGDAASVATIVLNGAAVESEVPFGPLIECGTASTISTNIISGASASAIHTPPILEGGLA